MAHHTLTLNWDGKSFLPDPNVLHVTGGDTISFQLGATAPSGSKFKITANDPEFLSPPEVKDSSTKVTVVKAVKTSYRCQLFDAGGKLLSSEGQPGTQVEPIKSKQS